MSYAGSLPDRQLRKVGDMVKTYSESSLPDRQLRKFKST